MAFLEVNDEPQNATSASGGLTASFVGSGTVPRPGRSSARAHSVTVENDQLRVALVDGRTVSVPLYWFPRLIEASPRERAKYHLLGDGLVIHWPAVDEDISVASLLRL